jgi:hypothetical protein
MATYPKSLKPWRGFPNFNAVHCIAAHVQQVNPDPSLGQFALTRDIGKHMGTIPAGATVLPAFSAIKTAFTAAVTIDVGSQGTPGLFMPTATIAPQTIANVLNVVGTGVGLQLATVPVFVLAQAAVPAVGAADFILPFYIHKD